MNAINSSIFVIAASLYISEIRIKSDLFGVRILFIAYDVLISLFTLSHTLSKKNLDITNDILSAISFSILIAYSLLRIRINI